VKIEDMIDDFKPNRKNNNPVLSEMAKMFFFDACRGKKEDKGYIARSTRYDRGEIPWQSRVGSRVTVEGNILVAYASTRNYVANETIAGDEVGGDWTNCLDKALRDSKDSDNVLDVLCRVKDLLEDKTHGNCTQTSEFHSSIGAKNMVYFKREAKERVSGKLFLNTLAIEPLASNYAYNC